MMTRIFTFFTVFLMLQAAFSQTRENLKKSKQLYIHGNSILVGNNVLGHHTTRPMMQDEVPNDAVNMKYIDVDDDKATFSSSQATIKAMPNDSDRKSTRLNSSHVRISYAVFCLKKKK